MDNLHGISPEYIFANDYLILMLFGFLIRAPSPGKTIYLFLFNTLFTFKWNCTLP